MDAAGTSALSVLLVLEVAVELDADEGKDRTVGVEEEAVGAVVEEWMPLFSTFEAKPVAGWPLGEQVAEAVAVAEPVVAAVAASPAPSAPTSEPRKRAPQCQPPHFAGRNTRASPLVVMLRRIASSAGLGGRRGSAVVAAVAVRGTGAFAAAAVVAVRGGVGVDVAAVAAAVARGIAGVVSAEIAAVAVVAASKRCRRS